MQWRPTGKPSRQANRPDRGSAGSWICLELETEGETTYAVVFTSDDGTQFALNGTACNTAKYRDLRDIWARKDGEYRNATNLIGAGLRLARHTTHIP